MPTPCPHLVRLIETSGGVRDDHFCAAHEFHDAHGQGHNMHAVALVVVEAALHSYNRLYVGPPMK